MDVRFATPYYRDGKIFCWLSNTGHWPDTGGAVPGGFSASATSVEQEGLRLPPVKLFKKGTLDPEIYSIITSNIRIADQRIGDVQRPGRRPRPRRRPPHRPPRPLRRRHRHRRHRRDPHPRPHPDAGDDRPHPRTPLARPRLPRQRRRGQRAPDHRPHRNPRQTQPYLRLRRLLAALRRPDELGPRHHPLLGLPGDAPHLPRGPDLRRRLRPAPRHRHREHLPRRRATPARSPAAPPKSASASPRPSSPPSSPPSPTA